MKKLTVYSGSWCNPCKILKSNLETVGEELQAHVEVEILDIDKLDRLQLQNLGIKGVPTAVLSQDGLEISRKTGAQSPTQLLQWLVDGD